jgi:hypothetical protein
MDTIGTKTGGPDLVESRGAAEHVIGGARWLGVSGDAAASEPGTDCARPGRTPSLIVLGSAHGPRLLELIRAAC